MWLTVLIASLGAWLTKLAGYVVPASWLDRPLVRHFATLLPVSLLAAIVAVQTVGYSRSLVLDGRLVGLGVAVVALRFRAPFVVVVVLAAVSTALLRMWGVVA